MTKYQGIILDLEDVVTDTTEYVFLAWKECVGWWRKHPRKWGRVCCWSCIIRDVKVQKPIRVEMLVRLREGRTYENLILGVPPLGGFSN